MCTFDNLQKIAETNEIVLGLMIDQLIKYGQEKNEQLKSITTNNDGNIDERVIELTPDESTKLNKVFSNIVQLLLTGDSDCRKAGIQYLSSLKEILTSYPKFNHIKMSDALGKLYGELCNKKDNGVLQDIVLALSEVKTLLYK